MILNLARHSFGWNTNIIDVITGIIASIKKGEPFKSRILRKGLIEKVVIYNMLMVSVFVLEYSNRL